MPSLSYLTVPMAPVSGSNTKSLHQADTVRQGSNSVSCQQGTRQQAPRATATRASHCQRTLLIHSCCYSQPLTPLAAGMPAAVNNNKPPRT